MSEIKRVLIAAGGTGGHMFPAQSAADALKRRGYEIILATDTRGDRYTADFPADHKFLISAATPSVGGLTAKIGAVTSLAQGLLTSVSQFRKRKPSFALGFGGYPSLPTMKAASLFGIPYGIHEQNGVLGRSNRLLAKNAAFVAHAFPVLDRMPKGVSGIEVGNPVRDAVSLVADRSMPTLERNGDVNILIFGGSQGASIFSEVPVAALCNLSADQKSRLNIVHQVRENEISKVRASYALGEVNAEIAPFFADLPERISNAHIVIARSGASTVTELSAIGRASILVPLGIAMDDHQTGNARVLSEASAAILLPERTFTPESLTAALTPLLANPARLEAMAAAGKNRVKAGAADALADLVDETLNEKSAE